MLDFGQIAELIETAIKNHNDEITYRHWLETRAETGMTYNEYMESLKKNRKQTADHRSAAEIDKDTAAIFAAAGM